MFTHTRDQAGPPQAPEGGLRLPHPSGSLVFFTAWTDLVRLSWKFKLLCVSQDFHYFPYSKHSMLAVFIHLDDTDPGALSCVRIHLSKCVFANFHGWSASISRENYNHFEWVGGGSQRKPQYWMNGHFIKPNFASKIKIFLFLAEWRFYKAKYYVVWK